MPNYGLRQGNHNTCGATVLMLAAVELEDARLPIQFKNKHEANMLLEQVLVAIQGSTPNLPSDLLTRIVIQAQGYSEWEEKVFTGATSLSNKSIGADERLIFLRSIHKIIHDALNPPYRIDVLTKQIGNIVHIHRLPNQSAFGKVNIAAVALCWIFEFCIFKATSVSRELSGQFIPELCKVPGTNTLGSWPSALYDTAQDMGLHAQIFIKADFLSMMQGVYPREVSRIRSSAIIFNPEQNITIYNSAAYRVLNLVGKATHWTMSRPDGTEMNPRDGFPGDTVDVPLEAVNYNQSLMIVLSTRPLTQVKPFTYAFD